jgi:AcrR family transcriptional regulator
MMAKGIDKDIVIETALALIDTHQGIKKLNFRDIARKLGCAHTNLYNYFPSFEALLWEAQETVMQRLQSGIDESMARVSGPEEKLSAFFASFIDFYLDHEGWFKLAWFEQLSSPRPQAHYDHTVSTVNALLESLLSVSQHLHQRDISLEQMRLFLHNIHCYVVGELSIFFTGRNLFQDKPTFRAYALEQSVKMLRLLMQSET